MPPELEKVFLAGATGLAGTNLVRHLLAHYPGVRIRGTFHAAAPSVREERVEYVQADLTKRDECQTAASGCDCAILAAASTGGAGAALAEPYRQMTDDLVMDAQLLEALYFSRVRRVIFLSSATVYQEHDGPIAEDALDLNREPHAAYLGVGWAKRAAEKLCKFWHCKYGQEIIVLRCSNIFGPFARFDPARSNFIPALIRKAVERMDPFEVWGSPEVARDVIYAEDFARAVAQLLLRHGEIKYDTFNLGSGSATTVGRVVELALKHAGHAPKEIAYQAGKPTTIRRSALDCGKIERAIGWKPAFSLEEGIRSTLLWWIENKNWWKK